MPFDVYEEVGVLVERKNGKERWIEGTVMGRRKHEGHCRGKGCLLCLVTPSVYKILVISDTGISVTGGIPELRLCRSKKS